MARSVRDSKLDSRSAREKLSVRGKPYYRTLDPGLHLGYRRLRNGPGRWVVRLYAGDQTYAVQTMATADDLSTANGVDVLDFRQAQEEARKRRDTRAQAAAGTGGYTVADAIADYLRALEAKGKPIEDTRFRAHAMILPELGAVEVADLTTKVLNGFQMKLASTPPRKRTPKGEPQQYRTAKTDRESVRRRRSTANRIVTILRAALRDAWREGRVSSSDQPWGRMKLFENVVSARVRYLKIPECKRLMNACEPEFRNLVRAALETGCRYGELCRLKVNDVNFDSRTVAILESKSGKARHVVLTEQGAAFFAQLCAGRGGSELLLRRPKGEAWGPSNQTAPLARACKRAKITPPATFHALRHTWASLAAMNGVPLMVVARNLGHADTQMVEQHYSHLAESYIAKAIRAGAPRFGTVKQTNIRDLSA